MLALNNDIYFRHRQTCKAQKAVGAALIKTALVNRSCEPGDRRCRPTLAAPALSPAIVMRDLSPPIFSALSYTHWRKQKINSYHWPTFYI